MQHVLEATLVTFEAVTSVNLIAIDAFNLTTTTRRFLLLESLLEVTALCIPECHKPHREVLYGVPLAPNVD